MPELRGARVQRPTARSQHPTEQSLQRWIAQGGRSPCAARFTAAQARCGSDDDAAGATMCALPSVEDLKSVLDFSVSQPFRVHVYFSVLRIVRNLRANPIGNLEVLIRLREFNFGNYNILQNIVVDIDLPSGVFMHNEVPDLAQNIPVAHRPQDFFGVGAGYRILKFCSNHTNHATLQGNGCFIVCDANSGFIAVVARYQSVSNL
jgi:hypothetical protein